MSGRPASIIVLDTNVVVSGVLAGRSTPASILRLILAGSVRLAWDHRVLEEYEEVLLREKFRLDPRMVRTLLDGLLASGVQVLARPLQDRLPDPDDEPFLEVALGAGEGAVLVTGNTKHFPPDRRCGVRVLTPREWLDAWRDGSLSP